MVYTLTLMSAVTLVAAQPIAAPRAEFVGPVQFARPAGEQLRFEDRAGRDRPIDMLTFDLSSLSHGAQLRLRFMRLKLKVPM